MRYGHWMIRWALYAAFFLCTAWGSLVGYSRFVINNPDPANWVPETQVQQLMQHHGTGVLKITDDDVYILRGTKWIPVLKRIQG